MIKRVGKGQHFNAVYHSGGVVAEILASVIQTGFLFICSYEQFLTATEEIVDQSCCPFKCTVMPVCLPEDSVS